MRTKTKIFIILGAVGCGLIFWWLLPSANTPVATINITTDNEAVIWTSYNDQEVREVGQGQYTFSSKTAGLLVVRATDNQLSAQTTVRLILGQTQDVHLEIQRPKNVSYYAPGAVSYPLITDNFVYGVNRDTYDLGVSRRFDDIFPATSFFSFPKVYRLAWFDEDNFVYSSRDRRTVGLVTGGNISTLEKSYSDFALSGEALFLLDSQGVDWLGLGQNQEVGRLWSFEEVQPVGQIFASNQHLYLPILAEESHLSDAHSHGANLNVYSLQGELVNSFIVSEADYRQIIEVGNLVFLATYRGLVVFNLETTDRLFEFELNDSVVDVLEYNESVYALTLDNGLWRLDLSQPQAGYHLLAHQPPNQTSVENSLVIKDDRLYFSSKTKPEALETATLAELSSVYYIELDSD